MSSSPPPPTAPKVHLLACTCAAEMFPSLRDRILADDHTMFERIDVSDGPFRLSFSLDDRPDDQERHEKVHQQQRAGYAPHWARWLPLWMRAWLGHVEFWADYCKEHETRGFERNAFEVAAREAERVFDDETPTPVGNPARGGKHR